MAGIEVLTDKEIQSKLKATTGGFKVVTMADGGGLSLLVQPSGVGWWRLRYWIAGRENRLSLGTYPDTGLALARKRRRDAQDLIAQGIDPGENRKVEKQERARQREAQALADAGLPGPGTFEHVAREWHQTIHIVKVSEKHAARTLVRFEQYIFPWLGRRSIGEIEPPDLLECLRKLTARGAVETAHRTKDACGQVFRYGVASGLCKRNPAADLSDALPPVQSRHFAAIVDPEQAAQLLRDIAAYKGHPVTCAALALSPLLLLRPGELRHMEWAWLDLDGGVLIVPSAVMKRTKADKADGPPHVVPLAPQAVTVLRDLQQATGHGRYVFPSLLTGERCMSDNTVRSALRRMGYGNDDMTAHGFRAMARTMAAERLGIAPEVIEAQLAHAVPDDLGRAYNRTQYLDQRRELMVRWADYVALLRSGTNVVPLKAA